MNTLFFIWQYVFWASFTENGLGCAQIVQSRYQQELSTHGPQCTGSPPTAPHRPPISWRHMASQDRYVVGIELTSLLLLFLPQLSLTSHILMRKLRPLVYLPFYVMHPYLLHCISLVFWAQIYIFNHLRETVSYFISLPWILSYFNLSQLY